MLLGDRLLRSHCAPGGQVALCFWGQALVRVLRRDRLCCVRDLANVALGTGSNLEVFFEGDRGTGSRTSFGGAGVEDRSGIGAVTFSNARNVSRVRLDESVVHKHP